MSEHKQPKPAANGIVTSDSVRQKSRAGFWRRWFRLILLGVVVLAACSGLLYRYIYNPAHKTVTVPKQLTTRDARKQFDTDLANAKNRLEGASSQQQKATAYVALGVAYLNKGQNKDAIEAINSAIAAYPGIRLQALSVLAFAYAYDGQRDKAITAFQEVISLLKQQGTDDASARIQAYQNDLDRLQQGQTL